MSKCPKSSGVERVFKVDSKKKIAGLSSGVPPKETTECGYGYIIIDATKYKIVEKRGEIYVLEEIKEENE